MRPFQSLAILPGPTRSKRTASETVSAHPDKVNSSVAYCIVRDLLDSKRDQDGFSIHFFSRVQDLRRDGGLWSVRIRDEKSAEQRDVQTKFVFVGAGGGALPLLQKSGIPEGQGYAGFPVSNGV